MLWLLPQYLLIAATAPQHQNALAPPIRDDHPSNNSKSAADYRARIVTNHQKRLKKSIRTSRLTTNSKLSGMR